MRSSIEKLKVIREDSRHTESMEERLTASEEGLKSTQDVLECNEQYSEKKFKQQSGEEHNIWLMRVD